MEENKAKYEAYLLPALCLVVGILIGILLLPMKGGRISVLSNNEFGSNNSYGNKADDRMTDTNKDQ